MLRFIASTLALFATFAAVVMLEGGSLQSFIFYSPLIIVALAPAFAVLAVWSLGDWGRAWKDAFAKSPSGSAVDSAGLWAFYERA